MNWFESFRRYALGKSPVRDNKIMCRAGDRAYKDNFRNVLVIMLSSGLLIGKIASDVISDASDASEIGGFIGILIGILIGTLIGDYIRGLFGGLFGGRFGGFFGFLIGNLIGGLVGVIIVFIGGFIGILAGFFVGDFIGDSVIDSATKRNIYLAIFSLIIIFCRFVRYDKWRLSYLGGLVVTDKLNKVRSQQWQVFHGLTPVKLSRRQNIWQWLKVRVFCGFKYEEGDIDHIIVCRKGVFFVETKTVREITNNVEITKNGGIINSGNTIVFKNNKICIDKNCIGKICMDENYIDKICMDEIYIKETKETLLEQNQIKQITDNAENLCKYINDSEVLKEKKLKSVIPIIAFPGWNVQGEGKGAPNEKIVVCNHEQISQKIEDRTEELPLSEEDVNTICELLEKNTKIKLFDIV